MVKLLRYLSCLAFHRWIYYERVEADGTRTPVHSCTDCGRSW